LMQCAGAQRTGECVIALVGQQNGFSARGQVGVQAKSKCRKCVLRPRVPLLGARSSAVSAGN
jgi:hypothetical protein